MPATLTGAPTAFAADTSRSEDAALFHRYARGDLAAREALVTRHMPMARRLAARYRNSSERAEDLEQVAYLGLLKAIDRYDPARGSFVSYAITNITGELKRHFRDHGWALRMARPLQERYLAVSNAVDALTQVDGRSPTPRSIAQMTGLTVEQVIEALEAGQAYSLPALDVPIAATEGDTALTLGDTVGAEDPGYASVELGADVGPVFRELPEREQRIVYLRFIEDLNQSEIAARVGCSQMHVSRLLRRALDTLGPTLVSQ